MEPKQELLTLTEVAQELRCSKSHSSNLVNGRVKGVSRLPHIGVGRRKLVRRDWLESWMEENKIKC